MTRGRHPIRALENAEKIALKRGLLHFYERGPGLPADFSITTRELKAKVKIKQLRRIRTTPAGLEREAAKEISGLRFYPSSHEISRELWIYSQDYFWRFFRVLDDRLVELARDSSVLQPKVPAGLSAALIPAIAVVPPAPAAVPPEPLGDAVLPSTSPPPPPSETFVGEAGSLSENDPQEKSGVGVPLFVNRAPLGYPGILRAISWVRFFCRPGEPALFMAVTCQIRGKPDPAFPGKDRQNMKTAQLGHNTVRKPCFPR